jgi:hypothetical protein
VSACAVPPWRPPWSKNSNKHTQNTNKTQLLASNYGTFWALVVYENFNPKTDTLLSSSMRQASCKCETPRLELKNLATFLAIKRCEWTKNGKVIKRSQSSIYKLAHICATSGKAVNSLTLKRVPARTKKPRSVGFLW